MFSVRGIFKARLIGEVWTHIGLGSTDVGEIFTDATLELVDHQVDGNWMWAVARSVENQKPFRIDLYAKRSEGTWQFDMQVGGKVAVPCFGLNTPYVFIPLSEIFVAAYTECKKAMGVTGQVTKSEEA